jgi:hypothetical protein
MHELQVADSHAAWTSRCTSYVTCYYFAAISSWKEGWLLVGPGARVEHRDWVRLIHTQVAIAAVRQSPLRCCHLTWTEGIEYYASRAPLERATRVGHVQTKHSIIQVLTPRPPLRCYKSLQYRMSEQRPGHLLLFDRIPLALDVLTHDF